MTAIFPADVAKEIRALAGPWLACLALIVLAGAEVPIFEQLGEAPYFVGIAVLGALSIGQEYSYRTLPQLLAQPIRRERIFAVKWTVLAVMLAIVTIVARGMRGSHSDLSSAAGVVLPFLVGLVLTPWLTMVGRSPIAGAVLGFGLPGTLFTAAQLTHLWVYGAGPSDATSMRFLWWSTLTWCAIGAVMSWRGFMRLEAIDGGSPDVRLWRSALGGAAVSPTTTPRHPVWLLVRKELMLQQLPMAMAALHIAGAFEAWLLKDSFNDVPMMFSVMTFFFCASIAVLTGAIASAEERQLGVLESQTLLPMASSSQWTIKALTAFALTFLLSNVLPSVLVPIVDPAQGSYPGLQTNSVLAAAVLTAFGLWVSSFATGGLRAMVLAVPIGGAILLPVSMASRDSRIDWRPELSSDERWILVYGLVAATIALLLRCGLVNHRSSEPSGRFPWTQVLLVGAALAAAVTAIVFLTLTAEQPVLLS